MFNWVDYEKSFITSGPVRYDGESRDNRGIVSR